MKKYFAVLFSVVGILFCLTCETVHSGEPSGLIVKNSDDVFQVFLQENQINPTNSNFNWEK